MTQGQTALHVEKLAKRFGPRLLFHDLSFRIEAGESLAVTGANGSGKSTLLRILAGVLTPSSGRAALQVDGRQVDSDDHPLHVGLVAPYLNVYDGFSTRENLAFLARARRLSGADGRVDRLLEHVMLADRADDPVSTFSSGMKQRVKFAAALLSEPPLLLLDEPSVTLDAAGLAMVSRIVEDHLRRRGLLVVATNSPDEAKRYHREVHIGDFV